jgi:hypothetical protein
MFISIIFSRISCAVFVNGATFDLLGVKRGHKGRGRGESFLPFEAGLDFESNGSAPCSAAYPPLYPNADPELTKH